MGRFQPRWDRVDWSTVELVTVSIGDAHRTPRGTQLRTDDTKLAREAVSFIDRVLCVFEDHAALVFELRADDEIKIEVWHWRSPCKVSNAAESNPSLAGSPITTLFLTSHCGRLLRFGTATARSRAHRATSNCGSLGCSLPMRVVRISTKPLSSDRQHKQCGMSCLTLLRTLEGSKDLRQQRETLSSVSLTCFGGVSSDLPFKAIQILKHHGIVADKYVLSPHSVNLIVPAESREAAVKALHSLI